MMSRFFKARKMKHYTPALRRGFSLFEVLVYVILVAIIVIGAGQTLAGVSRSYRSFKSSKDIEVSAASALERFMREAQVATDISAGSVLSSNPGKLVLTGTDAGGASRTVEFSLTGTVLHIKENGTDTGSLTASAAQVTSLVFRQIATPVSKAVKIEMTIQAGKDLAQKSKNFYATAVLRNSY